MSGILANKKIRSWLIIVAVGTVIWFVPPPAGVTMQAWRIFDIFVTTIVGFMLQPMPIGAISIVSLGITALLGLAKVSDVLAGFGNSTVWLVVVAFLLSRGFIQTGFGRRIALMIMKAIGHSTLRLSYSLVLSDAFFAPAMPSITARGGAFIYPIARGLCQVLGSSPGETARKAGAFLMMVASTGTCITSAMFLTAMAANPLAALLAEKAVGIRISWGDWALAGIVPGLVSLLLIPYVLYKIYPPELKKTPEAPLMAKAELEKMGPMDFNQKVMLFVFLGTIILWSTATFTQIDATTTAFLGLGVLLVTSVLTWRDCLDEYGAWDALIWLGVLVTLAGLLAKYGFVAWLAKTLGALFSGMHWSLTLTLIVLVYLYAQYAFASLTAHVTALYAAFLAVAVAAGAPALLAALVLGFFSNLCGVLTNYAAGHSPVVFGGGFVDQVTWWKLGFINSVILAVVWLGVGSIWWKVIGLW
jgi:divalent anion:Na+ symporter, DASS family